MTIQEQVNKLSACIEEFTRCINSLPVGLFLAKIDDWSLRDVLVHLIGWNRYMVEGEKQMWRSELPFYFVDPGDDFSKVNAVLVRKYASTNRERLLAELEASAKELRQFLASFAPAECETDFGVRYRGGAVTIQNTVDVLIDEYIVHRQRIEEWAR